MMLRKALAFFGLALALSLAIPAMPGPFSTPALAVEPDEVLADPTLEARARQLSAELRCLVCQNQSIDDSNAELAKDLRVLVRQRLEAGDSDQEVIDYLVSRYGEFVLLRPRLEIGTIALWATPFIVLIGGIAYAFVSARGRRAKTEPQRLTPEEKDALARVLKDS